MSQAKDLFEILMRENADMLLAFLRSAVRDSHSVDDLFQETMVVAWRRIDDFDRQRSFGKWIRGIAGKLVLAYYRKTAKAPNPLDESALAWLEDRFSHLHERSGDTFSEKLELLRECIAGLSADNRQAIEARYLKQQTLDQIVGLMGIALQTLKKRLYRAKLQLEACLSNKLSLPEDIP